MSPNKGSFFFFALNTCLFMKGVILCYQLKKLFDGEASVRLATGDVLKSLTKELMRDDISIESKRFIYDEICKMKLEADSWEDSNSRYWFKIGKCCGVSIGIVAGAGAFAIGEMIGKLISSKIES